MQLVPRRLKQFLRRRIHDVHHAIHASTVPFPRSPKPFLSTEIPRLHAHPIPTQSPHVESHRRNHILLKRPAAQRVDERRLPGVLQPCAQAFAKRLRQSPRARPRAVLARDRIRFVAIQIKVRRNHHLKSLARAPRLARRVSRVASRRRRRRSTHRSRRSPSRVRRTARATTRRRRPSTSARRRPSRVEV